MEDYKIVIISLVAVFIISGVIVFGMEATNAEKQKPHEERVIDYYNNFSNPDANMLKHTYPKSPIENVFKNPPEGLTEARENSDIEIISIEVKQGDFTSKYKHEEKFPSISILNRVISEVDRGNIKEWYLNTERGFLDKETTRKIYNMTKEDRSYKNMTVEVEIRNQNMKIKSDFKMRLHKNEWKIWDINTTETSKISGA